MLLTGDTVDWIWANAGVAGVIAEPVIGRTVSTIPVLDTDTVAVRVLIAVQGAHIAAICAWAETPRASHIASPNIAEAVIT